MGLCLLRQIDWFCLVFWIAWWVGGLRVWGYLGLVVCYWFVYDGFWFASVLLPADWFVLSFCGHLGVFAVWCLTCLSWVGFDFYVVIYFGWNALLCVLLLATLDWCWRLWFLDLGRLVLVMDVCYPAVLLRLLLLWSVFCLLLWFGFALLLYGFFSCFNAWYWLSYVVIRMFLFVLVWYWWLIPHCGLRV